MKILSMVIWMTQLGLSCLFPLCFFLIFGVWLQGRYGFGMWVIIVMGLLGFLTSIRTAQACLKAMRKEAERLGRRINPPTAFNHHI